MGDRDGSGYSVSHGHDMKVIRERSHYSTLKSAVMQTNSEEHRNDWVEEPKPAFYKK